MTICVVFLRRLWPPLALLAVFGALCVLVYAELEGLAWQDALFWIIHPYSIDYRTVRNATKFFSLFVYIGVFAFQIWIAERVLVTIFSQQGREGWKLMINEASIAGLRDHFIVCGYGQVGRTVVDQLNRLKVIIHPAMCAEESSIVRLSMLSIAHRRAPVQRLSLTPLQLLLKRPAGGGPTPP